MLNVAKFNQPYFTGETKKPSREIIYNKEIDGSKYACNNVIEMAMDLALFSFS